MQPCLSLPISHLGFLMLRWRRAPNKIWVRHESPNIRIQYLSHNRPQSANWHSSGMFFCGFDRGRLGGSDSIHTCPLHLHFLLEHMTTWLYLTHGGRWEPRRRMLFNPSDHEGWLVWVCLLCFNPQKRVSSLITFTVVVAGWYRGMCMFSFRFSKLASCLWDHFPFLRPPVRPKSAPRSIIWQDVHQCWQVCVWGRLQMTHLSFYFQAFFGVPSKHEGSSHDRGLANLSVLNFALYFTSHSTKITVYSLQTQKYFSAQI